MNKTKIRSTTIIGVRDKGVIALAGDGQVTFGDIAFKQKAVKVREFSSENNLVLGGFAGAAADALTLFEKFEQKLEQYEGDLKMLRQLEAMLIVMDLSSSFIIAGDGNVIEPDDQIISFGSGGGYAHAAAGAFLQSGNLSAKQIAKKSLEIASELCIYTNNQITVIESK